MIELQRIVLLLGLLFLASVSAADLGEDKSSLAPGKAIFEKQCVECHGTRGEGVPDSYEQALVGDASLSELTELIADTMPEEDPDACVGEDAEAVAKYIFDSFYSPKAQLRLNPPRKRLARLTANQLRQSLADLYESFGGKTTYTDGLGVRARYFNRDNKDGRVSFDRVDDLIHFDFGHDGPGQGVNAENYSIQWNTALKADVTGRHELIVRSTCAFVMYFGSYDREFINNYVQSENRTEFRKSIQLTGGRVYPLKIDLEQRKRKTEQPPAKVTLSWRTPHGVEQVIPATNFVEVYAQPTFALQTKLPPDDRSYGYERGIAVDRQWDEATTRAAIEFADQVVVELWPTYRKKRGGEHAGRSVLRKFLERMVETAFRGPLDEVLRYRYVGQHLDATLDDNEAIRRVLLMSLKSPRFLYPTLDADRSKSRRVANRLALTLFDSLPTGRLADEAKYNQLEQDYQVRDWAYEMIDDWRVRGKTRELLYSWLNLDHISDIGKDEERFPGFDEQLVSDLRDSLDRFLDETIWSERSDYRELLNSEKALTNTRIAEFYGDAWQPWEQPSELLEESEEQQEDENAEKATEETTKKDDAPIDEQEANPASNSEDEQETASDKEADAASQNENATDDVEVTKDEQTTPAKSHRLPVETLRTSVASESHLGILTHPYLMSGLAYRDSTSPIHRGVFLMRYVLGRTLRPPNEAFTPLSPDLHPDLTTRQRVELQTSPANCQVCHEKINGLGFVLENFDAVGRYQSEELGRVIDASGRYTTKQAETKEFKSARDLSEFLVESDDAKRAFVVRAFQHFVKQPLAAYGVETEDNLVAYFKENDHSIRKLLVEIAVIASTVSEASSSE